MGEFLNKIAFNNPFGIEIQGINVLNGAICIRQMPWSGTELAFLPGRMP